MAEIHGFDVPSLITAISGWVTALAGFVWTGGRQAQRFAEIEEKVEKLGPVHETLAAMRTDISWIKERLK